MSTIKADGIEASTGTNTDLSLAGKGTGVPDLAAGFKVGSVAGVPTASIRDDAVTLAKLAAGTDGVIITYDASGNPVHVGPGSDGEVLTSTGAGSPPAFEAVAAGGLTLSTEQNPSSGTSITFSGIPAGTKRIHINFVGCKFTATVDVTIELGDAGGIETSGYNGGSSRIEGYVGGAVVTSANSWSSFIFDTWEANEPHHGIITLILEDSSDNTWVASGTSNYAGKSHSMAGSKALSAELTQIRIGGGTFNSTATTFISISYD